MAVFWKWDVKLGNSGDDAPKHARGPGPGPESSGREILGERAGASNRDCFDSGLQIVINTS